MPTDRIFVFVFRRDLRCTDNIGLDRCWAAAKRAGGRIIPIFIFNKRQATAAANPYYSEKCFEFMLRSLRGLREVLPALSLYEGDDVQVLESLLTSTRFESLFYNADFTPFARARDDRIAVWCGAQGVTCTGVHQEYSLVAPGDMEKPYRKFTPFYKKYLKTVRLQKAAAAPPRTAFLPGPLRHDLLEVGVKTTPRLLEVGVKTTPRSEGLAIVRRISKGEFERYEATRDELFAETTRLSVYLKFGCVGVREVFRAVVQAHGVGHALIRQLFWRAFYDQVAYHFPGVLAGQVTPGKSNESLNRKYDGIPWVSSQPLFDAWCAGRTGFPIVDAGMRQLLATGYMHNRVRMVSANFLVKVLHIDWRLGERFFAQNLVDYDPSSNSGGWQWASGGGADSQQYYRVFSPWLQAEHHDPGCVYIKRHIPTRSSSRTAAGSR
ncbi:Deoxyribodipyrimidine photo-lyase [Tetrabaena socialis]|uniref:Deoxyribodipyrimidine photo-lyase n=1 Tax=Tetrabaena socialis TaxID=47790 RepID=A0A2J7ZW23_9CHLO|nr:Deoxyribodipyrimidine photo-lyase [Tetrabaena socialis]|eukprot:PNH04448.1 Deoxyribodipyrimidine photo-lyase [Tetrabaena socialis]